MLIGYARVSTDDQNLDLQRDALRLAGCEKVYEDRMSGAKAARPGLAMALEVARAGDVLTVWRLDRLGRSLHDLILLGRRLDEMGVGLMSVQEKIDTSSSGGRLVFHMFGALAEFERNLVRERTQAGLNAARARGRKGGRPKVLEPAKRQLAVKLYAEKKHTIVEICRLMGISKPRELDIFLGVTPTDDGTVRALGGFCKMLPKAFLRSAVGGTIDELLKRPEHPAVLS